MLLTGEQREQLDALAHSRTEAVRQLLDEHKQAHPAEADADPEERCPECGRPVALVAAGGSITVRAADASVVDYCRDDSAADWLYVHDV